MKRLWRAVKEWVRAVWVFAQFDRPQPTLWGFPHPKVDVSEYRCVRPARLVLLMVPGYPAKSVEAVPCQAGYIAEFSDPLGTVRPFVLGAGGRLIGETSLRDQPTCHTAAQWFPLSWWMPKELESMGFLRVSGPADRWIPPVRKYSDSWED